MPYSLDDLLEDPLAGVPVLHVLGQEAHADGVLARRRAG